ncbi:MAG: ABC transporter permease [Nocardiopsaceae bacterium]|nr:ABC transporter permease [Nocardiopsaceae bacterium]
MAVTGTISGGAGVRRSATGRLTLSEFRLFLREPAAVAWGIGFPIVLLIIFGSIPAFKEPQADYGGITLLQVYVPIIIVMNMALLAMVTMPAVLAGYREKGILRRLRTTPAGPARVLGAQMIVAFATALCEVVVVLVVARLAYGVPFPRSPGPWAVTWLLTAAALLAIGLAIAAVGTTGRVAQVIGNILFFPMMFFSGLWLPIPSMPVVLQHIAHATPLGAAWEAFQQASLGHWPPALPLVTMVIYAVVFGVAAARLFRWE